MDFLVQNIKEIPQYQSPYTGGDKLQSQILKRGGSEKDECLSGLKEFLPQIFAWGAYYVSFQKEFVK